MSVRKAGWAIAHTYMVNCMEALTSFEASERLEYQIEHRGKLPLASLDFYETCQAYIIDVHLDVKLAQ